MSDRIKYIGPSCGRYIDDDPGDWYWISRAIGFILLAFASGVLVWVLIAALFAIGDGP